ncbi:MAG: acyl-CoA thioesterase [Phycisphaerales bacterium]|nr:acyl-CoA thioesterase [Phycisphaerales bacterium]
MSAGELHRVSGSIRLRRTDAAGVMYFASAFEIAHEAVESYLQACAIDLAVLLRQGPHLPVVHAEADFQSPVRVGESYCAVVESVACSARSISFSVRIAAGDERVIAIVKIVHACVDPKTGASSPIPDLLRRALTPEA